MACAESPSLWAYLAGELEAEVLARVDLHLADCPGCRRELDAVRATREVLAMASTTDPSVDWRRADAQVRTASERRWTRFADRFLPGRAFALGLGATACALALFALLRTPATDPALPVAEPAVARAPQPTAVVEAVEGASVESPSLAAHPAVPGEALASGATLRTPVAGRALVRLPDDSRLRLGSSGVLVFARVAPEAVALSLEQGRVALRVSHRPRDEFLVEAGGVRVRVVGTAFGVSVTDRAVGVALVEGRVVVEVPEGEPRFLSAGERWVIERGTWRIRGAPLDEADRVEFEELGVAVPVLTSANRPSPSAARPEADRRLVAPVPSPSATPIAVSPEPLVVERPVPSPWPAAEAPALPITPEFGSVPVEEFILRKAEASFERGECRRYQNALSAYLEEPESPPVMREKARILRARCLAAEDRHVEADAEFRKYLREFPSGRFAAEARRVVAH